MFDYVKHAFTKFPVDDVWFVPCWPVESTPFSAYSIISSTVCKPRTQISLCTPYLGWRRIFMSLAGSPSSCSMSGNWNSKKYLCFLYNFILFYYSWEGTQPTMNNIWLDAENLYSRNWTYWTMDCNLLKYFLYLCFEHKVNSE